MCHVSQIGCVADAFVCVVHRLLVGDGVCLNTANQICGIMNKLNISDIVKVVWGNIVL
jgi:hypothetical protein